MGEMERERRGEEGARKLSAGNINECPAFLPAITFKAALARMPTRKPPLLFSFPPSHVLSPPKTDLDGWPHLCCISVINCNCQRETLAVSAEVMLSS